MSTQISLKLSQKMLDTAKEYAARQGYDSVQDFIRETLRVKLFEKEQFSGLLTYKAAESALSKAWLTEQEDEAWAHLQEQM